MGSIHYYAQLPEEAFDKEFWFKSDETRALTDEEREKIGELSLELEERTYSWIEEINKSWKWKKYYSDRFYRWLGHVYKANKEELPKATELYLHPGREGLYCKDIDYNYTEHIFFGFMNLDDVSCNFDIVRFLCEYVRRLSMTTPDLLWKIEYHGDAYYRGVPIIIKSKGIKYPMRTAPRKDRIPEYVKEALGPIEELKPEMCYFCNKADHKVTPQYLNKLLHAHEKCFTEFYRHYSELKGV